MTLLIRTKSTKNNDESCIYSYHNYLRIFLLNEKREIGRRFKITKRRQAKTGSLLVKLGKLTGLVACFLCFLFRCKKCLVRIFEQANINLFCLISRNHPYSYFEF